MQFHFAWWKHQLKFTSRLRRNILTERRLQVHAIAWIQCGFVCLFKFFSLHCSTARLFQSIEIHFLSFNWFLKSAIYCHVSRILPDMQMSFFRNTCITWTVFKSFFLCSHLSKVKIKKTSRSVQFLQAFFIFISMSTVYTCIHDQYSHLKSTQLHLFSNKLALENSSHVLLYNPDVFTLVLVLIYTIFWWLGTLYFRDICSTFALKTSLDE